MLVATLGDVVLQQERTAPLTGKLAYGNGDIYDLEGCSLELNFDYYEGAETHTIDAILDSDNLVTVRVCPATPGAGTYTFEDITVDFVDAGVIAGYILCLIDPDDVESIYRINEVTTTTLGLVDQLPADVDDTWSYRVVERYPTLAQQGRFVTDVLDLSSWSLGPFNVQAKVTNGSNIDFSYEFVTWIKAPVGG